MGPFPLMILLASGKGQRLWPLTTCLPKALLPVANVPILKRILRHLRREGCASATLSIGQLPPEMLQRVRDCVPPGLELTVAVGPTAQGTAAETRRLMGDARTLLVYYADTLCDLPLQTILDTHARNRAAGCLATIVVYRPGDIAVADRSGHTSYGVMGIDETGRVRTFVEKPRPESVERHHLANAAVFVIERELLERFPNAVDFSRDIFEKAAAGANSPLFAFDIASRPVIDCGTTERYLEANFRAIESDTDEPLADDRELSERFPGVVFCPPVRIGVGVVIEAGAHLGRTVVGDHSHIAAQSRLSTVVAFDNTVIGERAQVTNAIVGPHSHVGPSTHVHDATLAAWSQIGIPRNPAAETGVAACEARFRAEDGVLISPRRASRASDFQPTAGKPNDCPFCPGSEEMTLPAPLTYEGPAGWALRVVPNIYPASRHHEVVVETPSHTRGMEWMTTDEIVLVLRAWQERYRVLANDPEVRHVSIFKNLGPAAGQSKGHPHSQIITTDFVPEAVRRRLAHAQGRRYGWMQRDVLEDSNRERLIADFDRFLSCSPFAPRVPFETWIVPKAQRACFADIDTVEMRGLAVCLLDSLARLHTVYNELQYNLVVQTAPVEFEEDDDFCWHFRIYPRHNVLAGFELSTGLWINAVGPEDAAARLRAQDARG